MSKELDLTGLPAELVAQLSLKTSPPPQRELILDALAALDGIATKDEILIHVWRMSGQILKRQSVSAHLSMFKTSGMIEVRGNRLAAAYALSKRGDA
jgi:hypothetical protein